MIDPENIPESNVAIDPTLVAEMAQRGERHLQLALFFADKQIAQSVIEERFQSIATALDGREMLYADALDMRYVVLVARTQLNHSARVRSARNLACGALRKKYGFSDEEIDYLLDRKIQEERARSSLADPRRE